MTKAEWRDLFASQQGCCAICRRKPHEARMCIDHEHVPGWRKMPPEQRKIYVRGILCFYCNYRRVGRGINLEVARRMVQYLENYELRLTQ